MSDTPPLTIRVYKPSDHDAVVALNAYGLAAAGVPADADVYAGDLDNITTTYLTARSTLLIGELDGQIVAMGALREIDENTCEITRMRVTPHAQGRGYGKAVLAALQEQARRLDYRRAVLLTGPNQHPAIDLYKATGYTIHSHENHDGIAGVRLARELDE